MSLGQRERRRDDFFRKRFSDSCFLYRGDLATLLELRSAKGCPVVGRGRHACDDSSYRA